MARVLTDHSIEMLESIPQFLQREPIYQAIFKAAGEEWDIVDMFLDRLMRNIIASTADEDLHLWEAQLGLTMSPPLSVVERRGIVIAYLTRMTMRGSGMEWEKLTRLIMGTSWTGYQTHITGDGSTPPPATIVIKIPFMEYSIRASIMQTYLRSITPANTVINVTYADGFILDVSQLDDDLL